MDFPFFYAPQVTESDRLVALEEDTSKHMIQVLRMKVGEKVQLTNGIGGIFTCSITNDHRKKCQVDILEYAFQPQTLSPKAIAISLLKNTSRFEWFVEKATELGIQAIFPLIGERTEKTAFNPTRVNSILVSAMLQSKQSWLPKLHEPMAFKKFLTFDPISSFEQRFVAHCEDREKQPLHQFPTNRSAIVCIGPEGDFSSAEIDQAMEKDFIPVSLGATRLRTETAGMAAAVLLVR